MVDTVDSSKAQPGDFFRFETFMDVTVNHKIVIPANTIGYGIVSIASAAGRGGRSGTLVLEPMYLVLANHEQLGIVLDHKVNDLDRAGATGDAPGYLGAIPVPGLGVAVGAFNYFHRGQNVIVKKGSIFEIFASDDPATEHCQ